MKINCFFGRRVGAVKKMDYLSRRGFAFTLKIIRIKSFHLPQILIHQPPKRARHI
jgi:hypothetical protein